jgi:hypothetical protein
MHNAEKVIAPKEVSAIQEESQQVPTVTPVSFFYQAACYAANNLFDSVSGYIVDPFIHTQ